LIEAHADSRSSETYNEELAAARGQSVKLYLLKRGVKADRISTKSYGERQPIAFGDSAEAHAANRRIVISPVERK